VLINFVDAINDATNWAKPPTYVIWYADKLPVSCRSKLNWRRAATQLNESEQSWPSFQLYRHRILALFTVSKFATEIRQQSSLAIELHLRRRRDWTRQLNSVGVELGIRLFETKLKEKKRNKYFTDSLVYKTSLF